MEPAVYHGELLQHFVRESGSIDSIPGNLLKTTQTFENFTEAQICAHLEESFGFGGRRRDAEVPQCCRHYVRIGRSSLLRPPIKSLKLRVFGTEGGCIDHLLEVQVDVCNCLLDDYRNSFTLRTIWATGGVTETIRCIRRLRKRTDAGITGTKTTAVCLGKSFSHRRDVSFCGYVILQTNHAQLYDISIQVQSGQN